jgi:hypothetical protein
MRVDQAWGDQAAVGPQGALGGRRHVAGPAYGGDEAVVAGHPAAGQLPAVGVHGDDQLGPGYQQIDGGGRRGLWRHGTGPYPHSTNC